uniref:C2H2-type domain-containing protein n=1 Tax=Angiostrongylus cantonensis TaxID=6313 RepID=A0A158P9B9_ANGCA
MFLVLSRLRSPRFVEHVGVQPRGVHPYTPPPILSPMRNGSGLFWQIAKNLAHPAQAAPSICVRNAQNGHAPEEHEMDDGSPGLRIVDEGAGPSEINCTETVVTSSASGSVHPARKNGFICSQSTFADELEALRKISWASTSSSTKSAEDILRKHSMDPDEYLRKASCISDCYYDLSSDTWPKMSDARPHINIGREYQARVRKWNDRKIHNSELEAIEDRDEIIFSPDILSDIENDQIEAFELLACSQAIPRPGRNKELALHLLMENKGNIEAAVADLLRSDTLDWEQYQIIYGSHYLDSVNWSPEEVNAFQDAIYKTEKDFHQVAQESAPRTQFSSTSGTKKGAQPSADGFFHCRLCDKCFEKVKSLNAHMKSHAMKARAEAEAKAQVDAQLAATQSNSNGHLNLSGLTRSLEGVSPTLSTISNHAASGLSLPQGLPHGLLTSQGIGLPHPQAQHPLLSQVHSAIIH